MDDTKVANAVADSVEFVVNTGNIFPGLMSGAIASDPEPNEKKLTVNFHEVDSEERQDKRILRKRSRR